MPSSSGGALRRLAAETLVPDPFAAADVDDFGGRRTNETREALEVGLSASGPSSSNCFHERGIRAERRKLRTFTDLVLTYLLTCYLTHVAHHYRIHTVP